MATLKLRFPDNQEPLLVPLANDTSLLIGREPSLVRLDPSLRAELRGTDIRLVKVPSLRVSGNHLLVRRSGALAKVWDLESRHGSWLRLLPLHALTLPGEVDLVLDLVGQTGRTL